MPGCLLTSLPQLDVCHTHTHTHTLSLCDPDPKQVRLQNPQEGIPLIMEPHSGYYRGPVIVLDFRSLYPSCIIAYNLCFCTCLGRITANRVKKLGVLPLHFYRSGRATAVIH